MSPANQFSGSTILHMEQISYEKSQRITVLNCKTPQMLLAGVNCKCVSYHSIGAALIMQCILRFFQLGRVHKSPIFGWISKYNFFSVGRLFELDSKEKMF